MKKLFIVLACAALMSACKKEVNGCMDRDAVNFNADATNDNGSCRFEGQAVMWYGKTTADFLVADDAEALTYYVDGQIVGSSAASVYYNAQPGCGQGGVTFTKDLGPVKSKAYSYSVKDQTGFEYWNGTINIDANTCIALQLTK